MRRRGAVAVTLLAATLAACAPAGASVLRPIATGVTAFNSDGQRYVVWEELGEKAIVVLDTLTGRRRRLPERCPLAGAHAAAGRFLLECGREALALLDVRTGAVTDLPAPEQPGGFYGVDGPLWAAVGSHYVVGDGSGAHCRKLRRHEGCLALYDIATGRWSEQAESLMPEAAREGAPPLCGRLRPKMLALVRRQLDEGEGSLGDGGFAYADGVVVQLEGWLRPEAPEPLRNLLAIPCHGPVEQIPLHPERGHFPGDISLSGHVVSWDTGYPDNAFEMVEEGSVTAAELLHASIFSYDLRSHRERRWAPPATTLTVTENEDGLPHPITKHVRGVFGGSAHTARDVFWIGDRRMTLNCGKTCNPPEHEVSTIYEALL